MTDYHGWLSGPEADLHSRLNMAEADAELSRIEKEELRATIEHYEVALRECAKAAGSHVTDASLSPLRSPLRVEIRSPKGRTTKRESGYLPGVVIEFDHEAQETVAYEFDLAVVKVAGNPDPLTPEDFTGAELETLGVLAEVGVEHGDWVPPVLEAWDSAKAKIVAKLRALASTGQDS